MRITNKIFDENLKERFASTYRFSNHDTNKCILLLQKGVYLHEYMNHWEISSETSLPEKEDFCSHLNMEEVTDLDYRQSETVCKVFKMRKHWVTFMIWYAIDYC